MNTQHTGDVVRATEELGKAREDFRDALLSAHQSRSALGQLEAAAAHFCQAMRQQGETPERMLIDAKRVIQETIDGQDIPVAERAVLVCIQHYYRAR